MSIVFCLFETYFDFECNFLYKLYVPWYEIKKRAIINYIIIEAQTINSFSFIFDSVKLFSYDDSNFIFFMHANFINETV